MKMALNPDPKKPSQLLTLTANPKDMGMALHPDLRNKRPIPDKTWQNLNPNPRRQRDRVRAGGVAPRGARETDTLEQVGGLEGGSWPAFRLS